jgi:hypothetical protein
MIIRLLEKSKPIRRKYRFSVVRSRCLSLFGSPSTLADLMGVLGKDKNILVLGVYIIYAALLIYSHAALFYSTAENIAVSKWGI